MMVTKMQRTCTSERHKEWDCIVAWSVSRSRGSGVKKIEPDNFCDSCKAEYQLLVRPGKVL